MSLGLQRIVYFKTVAETQTLTRAAELLHVSQPALSKAISQLEQEVHTSLFDRSGRTLTLNEAGSIYLAYANRALGEMDAAQQKLDELRGIKDCTVSFLPYAPTGKPGYSASLFYKQHPEIVLEYRYKDEGDVSAPADVSLFASTEPIINDDVMLLTQERFVVVLPRNHPLAGRDSLALSELSSEPFILSSTPTMNRLQTSLCRQAGFEPKVRARLQLYSDVLGLVSYGLGITVAPRASWMLGYEQDFAIASITDALQTRCLYLRYPQGLHPSYATQKFSAFLRDYFAEGARSPLNGQAD